MSTSNELSASEGSLGALLEIGSSTNVTNTTTCYFKNTAMYVREDESQLTRRRDDSDFLSSGENSSCDFTAAKTNDTAPEPNRKMRRRSFGQVVDTTEVLNSCEGGGRTIWENEANINFSKENKLLFYADEVSIYTF